MWYASRSGITTIPFALATIAALLQTLAAAQAPQETTDQNGPGRQPPANQGQPGGTPPPVRRPAPPAQRTPWFTATGSFFERYRDDRNAHNGGRSAKGAVTYGVVTGNFHVAPLWTLYVRLGGLGVTQGGLGRDFNGDYYTGSHGFRGAFALDQFGAIYHTPRGLTVTLGRQDTPLDTSGTLYDQSWKVGLHSFQDGILAVQKTGWGSWQGFAFSEDQYRQVNGIGHEVRNGLYGARCTRDIGRHITPRALAAAPVPALTLGATVDRFTSSRDNRAVGIESTTNGEADAAWQTLPALQLKAEYGRSDAAQRGELYYGLARYAFTRRDSLTAFTYHIGDNADIGHGSAYPTGYRGARYFVEHDFDRHVSLILYYEEDHQLYGPGRSTSRWATLSYAF